MHLSTVVLFSGFAASVIATCAADNCLRAIRASAFPTRPGTADCSSYFLTTVSPATYTSTVYPTETVYANKKKRTPVQVTVNTPTTVTPTAIPAYASPCSGAVRYSSACSCIGVTPSITTLSTPSTTVTATSTATVVETLASISFLPFGNTQCSGTGGGGANDVFVLGQCTSFTQEPEGLGLDNIVAGSCADVTSCVINLFGGDNCQSDLMGSVTYGGSEQFRGCVDVLDAGSGILVCPDC